MKIILATTLETELLAGMLCYMCTLLYNLFRQSLLLGAPSPHCGSDGSLSLPQHNTAVVPSPLLLVLSVRHQRKPCAVLCLYQ